MLSIAKSEMEIIFLIQCTNFDMDDEKGMKLQFSQLKYLLNLLDPSFYAFLGESLHIKSTS